MLLVMFCAFGRERGERMNSPTAGGVKRPPLDDAQRKRKRDGSEDDAQEDSN